MRGCTLSNRLGVCVNCLSFGYKAMGTTGDDGVRGGEELGADTYQRDLRIAY